MTASNTNLTEKYQKTQNSQYLQPLAYFHKNYSRLLLSPYTPSTRKSIHEASILKPEPHLL